MRCWGLDQMRAITVGNKAKGYSTLVGSAPRSNLLPFYIQFLTEKLPLSYTFYHKTRTFLEPFLSHKLHLLALLGLFTDRNDRFPYPFIYFNKWFPHSFTYLKPEKRRGGQVLNKCLCGEAPPRGATPYPYIYQFPRKRYLFRIPSIDKWYPFHIPCLELYIPFNGCKCTVFELGLNLKNRTFSRLLSYRPS